LERLRDLIGGSESWLVRRVIAYARDRGYTKYTSTLEEAWRASIAGLSASLIELLSGSGAPLDLSPDDDFSSDPLSAFGVLEARRHRERGVTLPMFLGLMKYYRQSYVDLVREAGFPREDEEAYRRIVERFFDRVEVAFVTEWERTSGEERVAELSAVNRAMTNEKNKYLTLFESLPTPAFLLDREGRIDNANHAAAELLGGDAIPGGQYYAAERGEGALPLLAEEVSAFLSAGIPSRGTEKMLGTPRGFRQYRVAMHRMLDVSGKFEGAVVILSDLTRRREAEETLQVVLEELEERVAERTAEVARSHNLLTAVIGSTTDVIYLKDLEGRYLMVNPAGEQFLGRPAEEILGKNDLELFSPDCARLLMERDREIIRSGGTRTYEEVLVFGGATRFFSSAKGPYRDGDGNIIGLFGVTREITDQKREDGALRRVNRALRMMWEFSRALVRAKEEAELLSEVCRIAVEEGGYRLAWVGFAGDDPEKTVHPAAQFGFEEGYLQTLSLTWADTVRGRGPTGAAIRTGAPVVARDIQTDPSFEPWRVEALRRGYASSVALPFGEGMGALNIYSPAPDAFHPEEVLLLTELADMLAYGIRSLRAGSNQRKTVDTNSPSQ
jgi:PAS domain S-box-containing protein